MNEISWTALLQSLNPVSVLLAIAVALLLLNLLILLRPRRRHHDSRVLATVQQDLRALTTAAVGMGERLTELERRQRRLAERQDQMDIFDAASQPYDHAIQMAQQGARPEDLVKACGLSVSEAELITLMHRLDKAS
jgi:signal transduction histidine kinase